MLKSDCSATCNERQMLLSNWMCILESKPTCRVSRNVADATDHFEILCTVGYNSSCMTPVFLCDPYLSATHNHYSSDHVWYRRTVAASDIDNFAVLNCSMTFILTEDCTDMSPEIPVKPKKPIYKFIWSSPAIRIVSDSSTSKYASCRYK